MQLQKNIGVLKESITLFSEPLDREVKVDFYLPTNIQAPESLSLLLINDGQDLVTMGFDRMLSSLYENHHLRPLLCVGIHCGEDRINEYGMLIGPDFKGRGAKAPQHLRFILEELLPYISTAYKVAAFKEMSYAGFSLGGLSAMDIAWNYPSLFTRTGVFSGSLWWRSKDILEKSHNENTARMMHRQIRLGTKKEGMKFYFQCGELDETADRNKNGVIDSIDDTIDLMRELLAKGYKEGKDFHYQQLPDGKHDVPTWAKAFPAFLKWGWGSNLKI